MHNTLTFPSKSPMMSFNHSIRLKFQASKCITCSNVAPGYWGLAIRAWMKGVSYFYPKSYTKVRKDRWTWLSPITDEWKLHQASYMVHLLIVNACWGLFPGSDDSLTELNLTQRGLTWQSMSSVAPHFYLGCLCWSSLLCYLVLWTVF